MADLEDLARREGEAWARDRLQQMLELNDPVPRSWPGMIAAAYMVAEDLADHGVITSSDVRQLAERINDHAKRAWSAMARRREYA